MCLRMHVHVHVCVRVRVRVHLLVLVCLLMRVCLLGLCPMWVYVHVDLCARVPLCVRTRWLFGTRGQGVSPRQAGLCSLFLAHVALERAGTHHKGNTTLHVEHLSILGICV